MTTVFVSFIALIFITSAFQNVDIQVSKDINTHGGLECIAAREHQKDRCISFIYFLSDIPFT